MWIVGGQGRNFVKNGWAKSELQYNLGQKVGGQMPILPIQLWRPWLINRIKYCEKRIEPSLYQNLFVNLKTKMRRAVENGLESLIWFFIYFLCTIYTN